MSGRTLTAGTQTFTWAQPDRLATLTQGTTTTTYTYDGDGLRLQGRNLDFGQAVIAAGTGAGAGAICGVTLGLACVAASAGAAEIQYLAAPGPKSPGGAAVTGVFGAVLGPISGGSTGFAPLSGGLRYDLPGVSAAANWFASNVLIAAPQQFVAALLRSVAASTIGSLSVPGK